MINRRVLPTIGIVLLMFLAWLAYRPGLQGSFLFDDYANLPKIGETGPVDNMATFARYITSGTADPTGRPLAMASFLLDATNWPAPPYPFKRTSLFIHLLNGFLLYRVLLVLGRKLANDGRFRLTSSRAAQAALIGAGVWMLHPLFVSTTLYIVQREAMLPVTFALLGLLGWLHGRKRIETGRHRSGAVIALASIGLGALLGVLSKANGILLPVLVLALEYTILATVAPVRRIDGSGTPGAQRLVLACCWAVLAAIVMGLVHVAWQGIAHGLPLRPWTTGQRLLTEPRILFDYLGALWLPHPFTAGVFNDAIVVSTSLIAPWTTLPALLGVGGLTVAAVWFRARLPILSLAWLFFLGGHLIESTTVPLELYFEHRNYLSALLMFWPLGVWMSGGSFGPSIEPPKKAAFPSHAVRVVLAVVVIAGLSGMTRANATLWGDTRHQARTWAEFNPTSPRAQVSAAQEEINHGEYAAALERLKPMLVTHPEEVQLAFNVLATQCLAGKLEPADIDAAERSIAITKDPGSLIASWFDRIIPVSITNGCPGLDPEALVKIATAGLGNPNLVAGRHQDLEHVIGAIRLAQRRPEEALTHFDNAIAYDAQEPAAMSQAAELGSAGYPSLGLSHLLTYDKLAQVRPPPPIGMGALHAWVLEHQHYWAKERARLETTLRADRDANRTRNID